MTWLKMPKRISLSRPSSIINIISDIQGDLHLDWSETKEIESSGFGMLACLLDSVREKGFRIKGRNTDNLHTDDYVLGSLKKDDNKKLLSPALVDRDGADFIIRGYESSYPMGIIDAFKEKCPGILVNEDLEYDCNLILSELMQNTIDHSTGERFYVVVSGSIKEIMIAVLDMGVTIPAKLKQKYPSTTDLEYLEMSIKLDITTRRQRPGGKGLYYTLNALRESKGKLTMVSGNGQIKRYFSDRTINRTQLKNSLYGTWVFAQFPNRKKP